MSGVEDGGPWDARRGHLLGPSAPLPGPGHAQLTHTAYLPPHLKKSNLKKIKKNLDRHFSKFPDKKYIRVKAADLKYSGTFKYSYFNYACQRKLREFNNEIYKFCVWNYTKMERLNHKCMIFKKG